MGRDPFALKKLFGDDMLYKHMGSSKCWSTIYKPEKKIGENLYQDDFGIKWKKKSQPYGGSYNEFVEHPLADLKNYDNFKLPDPLVIEKDDIEKYAELVKTCGKEYAILASAANCVWECSWYLRGLENLMIDLYTNRDFVVDLFDKVMNYHLRLAKKLVEIGVDIVFYGDDVSCERGPLFDPKIYNELIKPRHAYLISEVKKLNKDIKIAYHSCGKIDWLLDDLIDIGVDIFHPVQPDNNDSVEIKKRYGKKLTFWGNVDTRVVLSHGSVQDVIEEVKKVIRTFAPGGGLIMTSNHTIQYTKRAVENTINYYWAANKLGKYPISI